MEYPMAFANISQRVAASYLRMFSDCDGADAAQRDCKAFFRALQMALYEHPEWFDLPLGPDDGFTEGEGKDRKQEVSRKLKKPAASIAAGFDFLRAAGREGVVEGDTLVIPLEVLTGYTKETRSARGFLGGLARVGLEITQVRGRVVLENASAGDRAVLRSAAFPQMMPALRALALGCAAWTDPFLQAFFFNRCDFGVLQPGYQIDPLDLYRAFSPAEYARLAELHRFFLGLKYQPQVEIHDVGAWLVKYQGRRQVKSTPLYQVEYQGRYRNPLALQIKPAATQRIAGLIPQQPKFLRDDFFQRANRCRGSECNWCRNSKTLGPALVDCDGEPVSVCWYTNPGVAVLNDDSVAVIRQYAQMHEQLG